MVIPAASAADTMESVCCSSDMIVRSTASLPGSLLAIESRRCRSKGLGMTSAQCDAAVDLHRQLAGQLGVGDGHQGLNAWSGDGLRIFR